MFSRFGHYIKPSEWLYNGELSDLSIKRCIRKQMLNSVGNDIKTIPEGLDKDEFLDTTLVRIKTAKKFKTKGILIPKDFDYSYKQLKYFYDKAFSIEIQDTINDFDKKLEEKIGKNDLSIDISWHNFVYSNYIKEQIKSSISMDKVNIDDILKVIESKDLNNFKEFLYMPKALKEVEKNMFTREQFKNDKKAIAYGDDAIRLLYVPPFALGVSILALLLNSVTVFGMILEFLRLFSSKKILVIKSSLIIIIILLPFIFGYNGFDNPFIHSIKNEDINNYISFLNWLGFYENLNSLFH